MCGMRRTNDELVRETATADDGGEQLDILARRGIRAVALLTGEYHHGAQRRAMIARAAAALRAALARGFVHVLVNIGALEAPEYDVLWTAVPRRPDGGVVPQVTMCTVPGDVQPGRVRALHGREPGEPAQRLRAPRDELRPRRRRGIWAANPGVLLGLNPDVAYELLALLAHMRHLRGRGMEVYVSLPRLRKATGTPRSAGVSDELLARIVAVLSFGVPDAKVVISTREPPAIQRRLLPVIGVLTPGSPGVAPYTETGARSSSRRASSRCSTTVRSRRSSASTSRPARRSTATSPRRGPEVARADVVLATNLALGGGCARVVLYRTVRPRWPSRAHARRRAARALRCSRSRTTFARVQPPLAHPARRARRAARLARSSRTGRRGRASRRSSRAGSSAASRSARSSSCADAGPPVPARSRR
jgi:hypothetical protein